MTNLRKFGIELECFNPNLRYTEAGFKIESGIRALGFEASFERSHFATNYDQWQIKPDSSLAPAGFALEVVSRVLPANQAGIDEATRIAKWLSSNGFDINQTCGYHIHLDASDMTVAEAAAVAFRYNARREEFNMVLPRSRHSSRWCVPLSGEAMDKVRRAMGNGNEHWTYGERYVAVNLHHLEKPQRKRHIEFRQHSGTLNADKIIGWYKLLCDFVAETLRLVREEAAASNQTATIPPAPVQPIIRRQRVARGQTRSRVVATAAPRVPRIEPGTDYDRFLTRLEQNGVITTEDAREFGWVTGQGNNIDSRLRVTAHWLRRNGAALVTTERNGELAYVGRDGARTRAEIFVNPVQVRQRVEVARDTSVAAPAPIMPVPARNVVDRNDLMAKLAAAPILQGASLETQAWYRQRREDFASL